MILDPTGKPVSAQPLALTSDVLRDLWAERLCREALSAREVFGAPVLDQYGRQVSSGTVQIVPVEQA